MKRIISLATVLAVLVAISQTALAQRQAPTQEQLIERRDAKLAEEFLTTANWITDYDKARAEAAESGKLIFAYFSRSYAP